MEFQQGDKVAMGLEDVVTGETPAPDSAAKAMTMASKGEIGPPIAEQSRRCVQRLREAMTTNAQRDERNAWFHRFSLVPY